MEVDNFRDENFGNVMEHFYDSTCMTILILPSICHGCTCMTKNTTYCDKHVSSRKCIFFVVSTVTHLGHIVVVLRRSPAPVTSSSPSPRRRADGTLPWPQLDQEFEGRHRAERVLIAEVPCVRYLIGWIAKTFDYINCVTKRFRFRSTRVRGHTLPARCYASPR